MTTVKAMTITVDSLLLRPKLNGDVGNDVAVKGPSVVVYAFHNRPSPLYVDAF